MLRLDNVSVKAGDFSLSPVSLSMHKEERHVLLGPSGSGKSTLLEAVIGFRKPHGGRLFLDGRELSRIPVENRGIGYVPQRLGLFPHLTVRQNILYGIRIRRVKEPKYFELAERLIEEVGLGPLVSRYPETLSGGERQRVALARALASAPRLFLLDEPFSALNESLRRELWILLKKLLEHNKIPTLMVTHDLEEAFFLGERISVLIEGKLHQSDAKTVVYRKPATVEVARFLGVRNIFPARILGKDHSCLILNCPVLKTRLSVNRSHNDHAVPEIGDEIMVGILPELVYLNHIDRSDASSQVSLKGEVIDSIDTGRGINLQFRPEGCDVALDVSVGLREAVSVNIGKAEVGLAAANLFWVPKTKR
ncbi:MAG: ABC transporter ATP-binding protein [Acidobacteria bacterium]|nr:ABC transporter ATP-binding protein [Acidobacteriota bacterium]